MRQATENKIHCVACLCCSLYVVWYPYHIVIDAHISSLIRNSHANKKKPIQTNFPHFIQHFWANRKEQTMNHSNIKFIRFLSIVKPLQLSIKWIRYVAMWYINRISIRLVSYYWIVFFCFSSFCVFNQNRNDCEVVYRNVVTFMWTHHNTPSHTTTKFFHFYFLPVAYSLLPYTHIHINISAIVVSTLCGYLVDCYCYCCFWNDCLFNGIGYIWNKNETNPFINS